MSRTRKICWLWSYRTAEIAVLMFAIESLENLLGASEWCSMVAAAAVGGMLQFIWRYRTLAPSP